MPTTILTEDDFTDGVIGVLDMMVKASLAASKGEARRLVTQGGVSLDDQKITDPQTSLSADNFKEGVVLKKGKKVFHRFTL